MDMTNMKMSPEESKKMSEPTMTSDKPQYPYGLCVRLEDDAIEKLGIESLPEVGSTMMMMARVEVQSASMSDYGEGKRKCLSLQITDMTLAQEKKTKSAEEALYGGD